MTFTFDKETEDKIRERSQVISNLVTYMFDKSVSCDDQYRHELLTQTASLITNGAFTETFLPISQSELETLISNVNPFDSCITKVGDIVYVMNRLHQGDKLETVEIIECTVIVIRLINSIYSQAPSFEIGLVTKDGSKVTGYNDLKTGKIEPSSEIILPGIDYQSNWFVDESEAIEHCKKMNDVIKYESKDSKDELRSELSTLNHEDTDECVG